jgi:hypothetical protein
MGSVGNEVAFTAPTNLYASFISPHPCALAVVVYGILPAEVYTEHVEPDHDVDLV